MPFPGLAISPMGAVQKAGRSISTPHMPSPHCHGCMLHTSSPITTPGSSEPLHLRTHCSPLREPAGEILWVPQTKCDASVTLPWLLLSLKQSEFLPPQFPPEVWLDHYYSIPRASQQLGIYGTRTVLKSGLCLVIVGLTCFSSWFNTRTKD